MMGYNTTFMEGFGSFWGLGMVLGPVLMISFWALILYIIVKLVMTLSGSRPSSSFPPDETPLEILKKRYARGEIDSFEFEQSKKDLQR